MIFNNIQKGGFALSFCRCCYLEAGFLNPISQCLRGVSQSYCSISSTVRLLSNANVTVASSNLRKEQPKISAGGRAKTKSLHKGLIQMMKGSFVERFCHCVTTGEDLWLLFSGFDDWTGSIQMKFVPNLKNRIFSLWQFMIGTNMSDQWAAVSLLTFGNLVRFIRILLSTLCRSIFAE
jgi:hypothetical protein